MMVFLFIVLFVIKDFFEFLLYFLTPQSTGEDGAVGGEEYAVWDGLNAVCVERLIQGVQQLGIGDAVLLDSTT